MKNKIEEVLSKHIGDGFVKIIFGPKGAGKTFFLFNYYKKILEEKGYLVIDLADQSEKNILEVITKTNKMASNKTILLVSNIFNYLNFDQIINACIVSKNVDLIATSDIAYPKIYSEKKTFINGRIFSIFYPSTTYDEYVVSNGKNLNGFLIDNNMNSGILENIKYMHSNQLAIYKKLITHFNQPATIHSMSLKLKNEFSEYEINNVYKELRRKFMFYELDRYDIKRNEVISTGKLIYPIDTRFYYLFDNKSYKINYKKYFLAASVARLFYDDYKVFKAIYVTQKSSVESGRSFERNTDGGLLAIKGDTRYLLFIEPSLNDEIINNIRKVPTNLPKYIVSLDAHSGPKMDMDGLFYCSIEYFLEKGLI